MPAGTVTFKNDWPVVKTMVPPVTAVLEAIMMLPDELFKIRELPLLLTVSKPAALMVKS